MEDSSSLWGIHVKNRAHIATLVMSGNVLPPNKICTEHIRNSTPEKHANDAAVAKNAVKSTPGCTARAMLTSGPKVKP